MLRPPPEKQLRDPRAVALLAILACALLAGCEGKADLSLTGSPPRAAPAPSTPGGSSPEPIPAFRPAPVTLRILLSWQYRNAVGALLGTEAANAVEPPPDSALDGAGAYRHRAVRALGPACRQGCALQHHGPRCPDRMHARVRQ